MDSAADQGTKLTGLGEVVVEVEVTSERDAGASNTRAGGVRRLRGELQRNRVVMSTDPASRMAENL